MKYENIEIEVDFLQAQIIRLQKIIDRAFRRGEQTQFDESVKLNFYKADLDRYRVEFPEFFI